MAAWSWTNWVVRRTEQHTRTRSTCCYWRWALDKWARLPHLKKSKMKNLMELSTERGFRPDTAHATEIYRWYCDDRNVGIRKQHIPEESTKASVQVCNTCVETAVWSIWFSSKSGHHEPWLELQTIMITNDRSPLQHTRKAVRKVRLTYILNSGH